MNKELLKMLRPLKKIVNGKFHVLTNEEKPTEPRTYRNYYKRMMEQLNIPPLKFHGLRHSFATRCIESNCDYKTVSVILTFRYHYYIKSLCSSKHGTEEAMH